MVNRQWPGRWHSSMACARPAPTPPVAAREWGGCRVVVGAHRQQFWVGAARLKRNVEEWWQWIIGSHHGG
jgi:hypothetical protein